MYTFTPRGVCSRKITIELDGDTVSHVDFVGGCNGNLKAISKVVEGMSVDEVANLWQGNTCGTKQTSCVDQLVRGLREAQQADAESRAGGQHDTADGSPREGR